MARVKNYVAAFISIILAVSVSGFAFADEGETCIRGFVWDDTNHSGTFEMGSESGIAGVSVSLYCSEDSTKTWNKVAETLTEADGSYAFADAKGERAFYVGDCYYLAFENPYPDQMQFTQYMWTDPSGYSLESHVLSVSPDKVTGKSETIFPLLLMGNEYCYVNAGFREFSSVTYAPGASSGVENLPSPERVPSGELYIVQGDTPAPTLEGYYFDGWVVVESPFDREAAYIPEFAYGYSMPALDDEYMPGDWFEMYGYDVVLEAQWSETPSAKSNARLIGYSGDYDGQAQQIAITDDTGRPWTLEGDIIEYFVEKDGILLPVENEFADAGTTIVTVVITREGEEVLRRTVPVVIAPLGLSVDIPSASKTYDGKPLECTQGTVSGLLEQDAEAVEITVSGSQTEVGSSKMSYTLDWGDVKGSNYYIQSENVGYLEVTPRIEEDPGIVDPPAGNPSPADPSAPTPTPTPTAAASAGSPPTEAAPAPAEETPATAAPTEVAAQQIPIPLVTGVPTSPAPTSGTADPSGESEAAEGTDGSNTPTVDTKPRPADTAKGNESTGAKQTVIIDDETPLAAGPRSPRNWVTPCVVAGLLVSGIYGMGVILRRRNHAAALSSFENNLIGVG